MAPTAAASAVFSDYEIRAMAIKVGAEGSYKHADCVGSCEEEAETLVVTKNCRGTLAKKRVKGTGAGTLTLSLHIPYDIYTSIFGMDLDGLIEGVKAYGRNSVHPEFSIVMDTFDEDGIEKFRAYPKCIMESGVKRTVENGAEEVAELELEISWMPDEYGNGIYECLVSELGEDTASLKTKWMTDFEPSLAQAPSV